MVPRTRNAVIAVVLILAAGLAVTVGFSSAPPLPSNPAQKALGPLTPAEALVYMQKTPEVFILDIRTAEQNRTLNFVGSHHIPVEELAERFREIPEARPVIIICRSGNKVKTAYPLLMRVRPDIPEISYIDSHPLFNEYNAWVRKKEEGRRCLYCQAAPVIARS